MNRIPLALPWMAEEEAAAAREALLSGWVTQGPRVARFEEAFAGVVGARAACAVSSCTAALHVALLASGVRPGDVVLTVSHSFIASANAIRHCGAEPFFVDIDGATLCMDPDALERALRGEFERRDRGVWLRAPGRLHCAESPLARLRGPTGRLAAILVVHQVGMPADLGAILPIAAGYGVPVLEDAACAAGSEIRLDRGGRFEPVGKPHGLAACFSFHPRKLLTTGDGGMITSSEPSLVAEARALRHHGMSVSDLERHLGDEVTFESYSRTGYNYRMTDIQAAVGIEQLKRLPLMLEQRRLLAAGYAELLRAVPGIEVPAEPIHARTNWQSYVVRLARPEWQLPVMRSLRAQGIATARGVMCAHLEPPYQTAWPRGSLPVSEAMRDRGLMLPLHHRIEPATQQAIATALVAAIRHAAA